MVKNLLAVWDTQVQSLGQEDPLEKGWQPTPVFLPENPMDRGAWQVAELDTAEQLPLLLLLLN